jgi:hypothetical protein
MSWWRSADKISDPDPWGSDPGEPVRPPGSSLRRMVAGGSVVAVALIGTVLALPGTTVAASPSASCPAAISGLVAAA